MSELLKDLFIPTWDNEPPYRKPILSINGVGVLSFQNISCIIAQPGAGKSSTNESILSAVINKDCDCLGFETNVESVMYIDFERTEEDVWKSFERVMRRSKTTQGTTLENIQIISFRNVPKSKERKQRIELLLENYKPELLLLDGIGDLVDDTNSLEQAIECKNWIRLITSKFKVSILTTLHPNKGSLTPRGHIGSEVLRESEGVLAIMIDSNDVRTLTSDFEHGKARNGGHATTCFKWNDENKMFNITEVVAKTRNLKFSPEDKLTNEEVINLIKATHTTPLNTAQSKVALKDYLQTNITHVKTHDKDIKNFLDYLVCNNYLTQIDVLNDKRNKHYKIHTMHEKK
jgi:hypothetical protein